VFLRQSLLRLPNTYKRETGDYLTLNTCTGWHEIDSRRYLVDSFQLVLTAVSSTSTIGSCGVNLLSNKNLFALGSSCWWIACEVRYTVSAEFLDKELCSKC